MSLRRYLIRAIAMQFVALSSCGAAVPAIPEGVLTPDQVQSAGDAALQVFFIFLILLMFACGWVAGKRQP